MWRRPLRPALVVDQAEETKCLRRRPPVSFAPFRSSQRESPHVAKRPAHKKPAIKPQPEPAQLKAVERLLDGREYAEAARRIRALLRRFPDHRGLHRTFGLVPKLGLGTLSRKLCFPRRPRPRGPTRGLTIRKAELCVLRSQAERLCKYSAPADQ